MLNCTTFRSEISPSRAKNWCHISPTIPPTLVEDVYSGPNRWTNTPTRVVVPGDARSADVAEKNLHLVFILQGHDFLTPPLSGYDCATTVHTLVKQNQNTVNPPA